MKAQEYLMSEAQTEEAKALLKKAFDEMPQYNSEAHVYILGQAEAWKQGLETFLSEMATQFCKLMKAYLNKSETDTYKPTIYLIDGTQTEDREKYLQLGKYVPSKFEDMAGTINIYDYTKLSIDELKELIVHNCAHHVLYSLGLPYEDGTPEHEALCIAFEVPSGK